MVVNVADLNKYTTMRDPFSFWILAFMIGTSFALEPSCPICSKYDFEEKLLERIIQNEFALKFTLDKITETQAKVEHTLTRIKDEQVTLNDVIHALEVTKQNVSETVKLLVSQTFKDFEITKQDLRSNVDVFIKLGTNNASASVAIMNSSVQSFLGQMSTEMKILQDGIAVPLVMFHARHQSTGSAFSYASNQDVVYKTVLANEGGGYSPETGHFTASVAGMYLFTVQYCPLNGQTAYLEIVHKDKPVQRSRHGDPTYNLCVTMQAFAKMSIGDNVWVRCIFSSSVHQHDPSYWNSFAGMLIHV